MDEEGTSRTVGPWGADVGPFSFYHENLKSPVTYAEKRAVAWIVGKIERGEYRDWDSIARELKHKGILEGTPLWNTVQDEWNNREA